MGVAIFKPQPLETRMTPEERSNLILAFARVLFINGESTQKTLDTAERVSRCLGVRAAVFPRWGELEIRIEDNGTKVVLAIEAVPSGVEMSRVASALTTTEELCNGRLLPAEALEALNTISTAPPSPTWLFTLAAAVGAVALAVLFGIRHFAAAALIFGSAAAGALLRRTLTRYSSNMFLQPFSAALVAGVVGSLAVRYELSSSLRLVALCPCMVLVPGPHFLNGMFDLIRGRITLGSARLIYAVLIVVAISTGLLLGMAPLGVFLPVDPGGRAVPLWTDVIAAGIAVACFSVFFSSPVTMLPLSVGVGALAHALRWVVLTAFGGSAPIGTFVGCLIVGVILTPVSRHRHMPFVAVGFASVVSMMPGALMFRMAGGLLQLAHDSARTWDLTAATVADGWIAFIIVLAMSFGLIVPKVIIDYIGQHGATP